MPEQTTADLFISSGVSRIDLTSPVTASPEAAVPLEARWREPPGAMAHAPIAVSRWTNARAGAREERNTGANDRYVVGVAMRPVRTRIGSVAKPAFEGILAAGAIHITAPGRAAEATFFSPSDFLHFHVTGSYVRDRQVAAGADAMDLHDLVARDELAAILAHALTAWPGSADPLYAESVGRTILMRVLANRRPVRHVSVLPAWRLRRVHEYLARHLADPIRLADLAAAAGLSRMHFAAQFKAATGFRPHDFVVRQRIETAKAMLMDTNASLVNVALDTGFQTQSHFSTVFKRLVGETPGRWQRAHCHG